MGQNECGGNFYCGLVLLESHNNRIATKNILNENGYFGLYLAGSDNNLVQQNTALVNGDCDLKDEGVDNSFKKNDFGNVNCNNGCNCPTP